PVGPPCPGGCPDGIEGGVAYCGPLATLTRQFIGRLRRSMFYVGTRTTGELAERGQLVRITRASLKESHHPHDIWMTVEAPNLITG
ncbi:MAG: hypothetical protein DLM58_18150, partial [Pseudonocardiales bacterium]